MRILFWFPQLSVFLLIKTTYELLSLLLLLSNTRNKALTFNAEYKKLEATGKLNWIPQKRRIYSWKTPKPLFSIGITRIKRHTSAESYGWKLNKATKLVLIMHLLLSLKLGQRVINRCGWSRIFSFFFF